MNRIWMIGLMLIGSTVALADLVPYRCTLSGHARVNNSSELLFREEFTLERPGKKCTTINKTVNGINSTAGRAGEDGLLGLVLLVDGEGAETYSLTYDDVRRLSTNLRVGVNSYDLECLRLDYNGGSL